MNKQNETKAAYSYLWSRGEAKAPASAYHFNAMQAVIDEPIVRPGIGIEVGSGPGYDTYLMAKNNPSVNLVSMDISDGIYKTRELTAGLGNVRPVRCSALQIPFKRDVFDFAYSFGVLHHTDDPRKGVSEIVRILKKDSPVFLYLYEDHSENPVKYIAVKIVAFFRALTVRIPSRILFALCTIASPFIYLLFTLPSKVLRLSKHTRPLAEQMPFNFGTHPFSLRGDLYDRFSAPVEFRFSRAGLVKMLDESGFKDVKITRLNETAGWVAWGHKR